MTPHEMAKAYALEKAGLRWEQRDNWRDQDRTAYLGALAEFRQLNPHLFTAEELASAETYASAAAAPAPEFSYINAFIEEAGAQVKNLNAELNPFAEENRAKTRSFLTGLAALAAVVFFGVLAFRTSPRNPSPTPPGGDDLFAARVPAAPKKRKRKQ